MSVGPRGPGRVASAPAFARRALPFVLAGLALAAVSLATLWPSHEPPRPPTGYLDKVQHFGAWGFLAVAGWPLARRLGARRSPARRVTSLWLALAAYGGLIELIQLGVPGRSCELLDLVADALGAAVGAVLLAAWERRRGVRAEVAMRAPGVSRIARSE